MSVAYLVQGLGNNTLVAGKTTALRLVTAPQSAAAAAGIQATVVRPDGSVTSLAWTADQLKIVDPGTATEGIAVLIPGTAIPDVGVYYIRANMLTADGAVAAAYTIDAAQLLPTKDLRMMVNRIWSATGPSAKPGEIQAATDAMTRLATLYPIRDGISTLDGDASAGLRYNFDNNPQGPPNQDGNLGPSWDPFRNPAAGGDSLDTALAYRFPDAGEGSGAATQPAYNAWLPWSLIVWQGPIPQVFSHETGHNHGLEPPSSPHFDPTGQASHSKDEFIDPADAAAGFDIQFNQPFPVPTYDIMFPTGPAPGYNPQQVSLNSWDWEFVRTQLLKSTSTGPHQPWIQWQSLGGHDLLGYPCAIRNSDGRLEVFVLGGDQSLYHIWENSPGGGWSSWGSLAGTNLAGPVLAAANADGRLQVFICGSDLRIYSRAQHVPNGDWDPWFSIGGDNVKGFAVSQNSDGRLEIVAVFADGGLYDTWQVSPNGAWSGWSPLAGQDLNGPVALAANADGRLEAFVVGGDGNVYHRWQTAPDGRSGWSGWANLIDPRLVKVADLRAGRAADGRLVVILMTVNQSVSYLAQTTPNGGWNASVDLYGHGLLWPCGLGRAGDGRLEVAVIGGDQQLYSRWQVDPSRSGLWANWTPLGGQAIRAGVALAANHAGQLELFVVGSDGALYRGPRSGA